MIRKPCSICGKQSTAVYKGVRYCPTCWKKRPVQTDEPVKGTKPNGGSKLSVDGDLLKITTYRGEQILADAEDAGIIEKHSWTLNSSGYPVTCIEGNTVKLSRYVLEQHGQIGWRDRVACQSRQDVRKSTLRVVPAKH